MQSSRFNIFVADYPNPGEHLVYNARTQALVKIGQPLRDTLDRLRTLDVVPPDQVKDLFNLFKMGIIVKDDADENERFERFIEQKKYGIDRSHFIASILTTYNCNFACTYCFEESTRTSNQKLDRKTSDAAIAWLKKKIERHRMKQLVLNFYGGEPLLNQPELEYISLEMKPWCEARGVEFKVMLQTNGALLTKDLVRRYKEFGLYKAKVSLDGTREVNDKNRPVRGSGKGTFDTVVQNVIDAVDEIQVSIAMGYDNGDPAPVLELMEYFDGIGILKKLDGLTYSPIHPGLGPKGHAEELVSPQCMSNYDTDKILGADRAIKAVMKEKGMRVKSGLSVTMCPVTSGDSGVTIDTQGSIYKCNAMLGHPELAVGTIYEDEYNDTHKKFLSADNWKKCDADCPYAPICNNGCRLFAFFKEKDFTAKSCERAYMDKFVPQGIKLEYENRMKRKSEAVKA